MLIPPQDEAAAVRQVHGFMRSCVAIPPGRDLTAPVADEPFTAEHGELHR